MAHPIFESHQFIHEIATSQGSDVVALDAILERALINDAELRDCFRASPQHHTIVAPLAGLVNPFDAPEAIRRARPRVVGSNPSTKYIMSLSPDDRRPEGAPCLIDSIDEFNHNLDVFSEGLLAQIFNWNNIVLAGNCVQACMVPPPTEALVSNTTLRRFYHEEKYPSVNLNIYLYGLNTEQAIAKIRQIHASIQLALPVDIQCIKSNRFITFYSQYPFRPVQIALCIYQSPVDILTSLSIDCEAALFDGKQVYMSARAIMAAMQQRNTIDMSRKSPSYENQLINSGLQSFEIYVPDLQRENVDPGLYCRPLKQLQGLGRLIVSEKLYKDAQGKAILNGRVDPLDHRMVYGPGWTYDCTRKLVDRRSNNSAGSLGNALSNITFYPRQAEPQVARLDYAELALWSKDVYLSDETIFFSAIATHNISKIRTFSERKCFDLNRCDDEEKTALHISILVKAESIATLLIDRGVKISPQLCDGRNALHLASQFDMPNIVEQLLKRSDTNKLASGTNSGDTPIDVIQIDLEDNEGSTALCHAMFSGSKRSIELLLKAGARLDLVKLGPHTQLYRIELKPSNSGGPIEFAVVDIRRNCGWVITSKSETAELQGVGTTTRGSSVDKADIDSQTSVRTD